MFTAVVSKCAHEYETNNRTIVNRHEEKFATQFSRCGKTNFFAINYFIYYCVWYRLKNLINVSCVFFLICCLNVFIITIQFLISSNCANNNRNNANWARVYWVVPAVNRSEIFFHVELAFSYRSFKLIEAIVSIRTRV